MCKSGSRLARRRNYVKGLGPQIRHLEKIFYCIELEGAIPGHRHAKLWRAITDTALQKGDKAKISTVNGLTLTVT
jgi:membrane protein implicated in regulation of membrane protease activity